MVSKMQYGNFCGETIRQQSGKDFTITVTTHKEKTITPAHVHEMFYVCYVLDGAFDETTGSSTFSCSSKDLIIHPKHIVHKNIFSQAACCLNIELQNDWLDKFLEYELSIDSYGRIPKTACSVSIAKIAHELRSWDSVSPLQVEALILDVFCHVFRESSNVYVKRIKEYVIAHFDQPLSLKAMASELDLHPVYMCSIFKKFTRLTIGEFQRAVRIEKSIQLLQEPSLSLLSISIICGFNDQPHFQRMFKSITGCTPHSYRRRN